MIIYLSITIFVFLLISLFKNRTSVSMRFLVGIFSGWLLSIFSLIIYLSKQNYYWKEINTIFYMNQSLWNALIVRIQIRPEVLIRFINVGVGLLYYSALCFVLAFTRKPKKNSRRVYILLSILPIMQMFLFDPFLQKKLQEGLREYRFITYEMYNTWFAFLSQIFHVINLIYVLAVVILLVHFYVAHPKIKFLRVYTLLNLLCVAPTIFLFYYLFRWYPMVLIKITMKAGYYNFLVPNFRIGLLNNYIFSFVFLITYVIHIVVIFKYNTMESYYQRDYGKISISLDTASLGVNTFTHAIKNHIQGIYSETVFIEKQCQGDEEVQVSTRLIRESCEFCFESIENANKQLKNINLTLKLKTLEAPVLRAIGMFHQDSGSVPIHFQGSGSETMAYIDEDALTEVLINMIKNAQEALEGKEDGYINVSIREQGRWGIVEIHDNGHGIDAENINKIFTPFFSTKATINNWGIGLAYCYKVVNAHDGKISVESNKEDGTIFSIALPII